MTRFLIDCFYKLNVTNNELHLAKLHLNNFVTLPELTVVNHEGQLLRNIFQSSHVKNFYKSITHIKTAARSLTITDGIETFCLLFNTEITCNEFITNLEALKRKFNELSSFDSKIDLTSSEQYFHYYGQLGQQQNMLQDYIRTSTYQLSMLENSVDFRGKIVLDVGCGTGILSFFAIQAGALRVYAVEASNMALHAQTLSKKNGLEKRIIVLQGKIEEVTIPEPIDIIVSEPMGILLVNERMLESFLYARKWLKEEGQMFPTCSDLYCAPFQDDLLFMETVNKATFWSQNNFYGVNLQSLYDAAIDEFFGMPIVDAFDSKLMLAKPIKHSIDFSRCCESDLERIAIPFSFPVHRPSFVHGLCFWFDVLFAGSMTKTWLSTGPSSPLTHWYQVRCLVKDPVFVTPEDFLTGNIEMIANAKQSYTINIQMGLNGNIITTNKINLKDPLYRLGNVDMHAYNKNIQNYENVCDSDHR